MKNLHAWALLLALSAFASPALAQRKIDQFVTLQYQQVGHTYLGAGSAQSWMHTRGHSLGLEYERMLGPRLSVLGSLRHSWLRQWWGARPNAPSRHLSYSLTAGLRYRFLDLGPNASLFAEGTVGLERHAGERLGSTHLTGGLRIGMEYSLTDRWKLMASVGPSYSSLYGLRMSPMFGLKWGW